MHACVLSHSVMPKSLQPYGLCVAHQAPLSMGFSRQEYWSGLPCPPPGDLLDPGIEPRSPALLADSLPSEPPGKSNNWHNDFKIKIILKKMRVSIIKWPKLPPFLPQICPELLISLKHCSSKNQDFFFTSPPTWEKTGSMCKCWLRKICFLFIPIPDDLEEPDCIFVAFYLAYRWWNTMDLCWIRLSSIWTTRA